MSAEVRSARKAHRGTSALVQLTALLLVACGTKGTGVEFDAGDAAVSTLMRDGGTDAASNANDGGLTVDDLAMPQPSTEEVSVRMRHLLEAIAQNNPELANDVVFPRDAFISTRDSTDPQSAWEKKLSTAFRRAVERGHKRTKGVENAKFVRFDLGRSVIQGAPKKQEWKRPLWKVKHSKLTFSVDGKQRSFEIPEMTAWRGAWYVTRLK